MFCVKVTNSVSAILKMLAGYNVSIEIFEDTFNEVYLLVLPKDTAVAVNNDFRMAEAVLQMNCHQSGELVCPFCASQGKLDCCGHLTFTKII